MNTHIVVLTGAGISKESGINTFRDANGLWEQYAIEDVASIDGWYKNPQLVLDFYNARRSQLAEVTPNNAHILLAKLEEKYRVSIITQNVDNLHERAGSTHILHLHGELTKVRSTGNESDIMDIGYKEITIGDTCTHGYQLRPHIVWFGEAVPLITEAIETIATADIVIIIGTSMQVYPAASLINYASRATTIYFIDPNPTISSSGKIHVFAENATTGMQKVFNLLY